MKIAEAGHDVDLISVVPVKRSHSVCAQGGINGAVNTKGEGDSPAKHLDDTVYGGDFLANQPPVKRMTDMAPEIIYLFDRMGVPFSRTKEEADGFQAFWRDAASPDRLCRSLDRAATALCTMTSKSAGWEVAGKVTKYRRLGNALARRSTTIRFAAAWCNEHARPAAQSNSRLMQ
jgi:succinate dehydrogenase / fumarate reductase flavoprotein subunit